MDWTILNTLGIILTTIFCAVYIYFLNEHRYWAKKNVPYVHPTFPFGNISKVILRKQNFIQTIQEMYINMKGKGHRYAGIYFFSRKALLIIDPDMAKNILTTDFQNFHDRGLHYDEINDPLSANLVVLNGEKWKNLRSKLTPTFSSGKLKTMFPIIEQCANELTRVLQEEEMIEIKEFVARYTTDVIGSCAFGIDCNSLKNPDAEFRKIGKRMFNEQPIDIIRRMCFRSFPSLAKKLKIRIFDPQVSSFFMKAVVDTVTYRKRNNIHRSDFLQLLIELMEKGDTNDSITLNEAAAQAFVFFLGGFETSASTITFALYELASNIDIQRKLRQEIKMMLHENNDELNYNNIIGMTYMEKVMQETLRKWPTVPLLMRKCTKDYKIPTTDTIISKGVSVIVPSYAFHRDEQYYPSPEIFNPDRFETENDKTRRDHTYLPFGNGPRICIGLRFANVQVKVALVKLISQFEFSVNERTRQPLEIDKNPTVMNIEGGVWLNIKPVA